MTELDDLNKRIAQIGNRMVRCRKACEGVARDPEQGILPRCLFFEADGRGDNAGCAIVGLNPGRSSPVERNFYLENGQTYPQTTACWHKYFYNYKYYARLRHLANELGFLGPILWSELAKCESAVDVRYLPLQTFRICTNLYLTEELQLVSKDWPLLAVGREAYRALGYLYPRRVVIGVPHPTGSFGQFGSLFTQGMSSGLRDEFRFDLASLWNGDSPKVVWLDAEKGKLR